ncbi:MAG: AI-2E family transporter [Candidatus Sericytochromatia bacterium]
MDSLYKIRRNLIIALLLLIFTVFYFIHHLLMPFVVAALFIYLGAPIVAYLSEKGIGSIKLSRSQAVIVLYICFFGILTILSIFLFPLLVTEVKKIASEIPAKINDFKDNVLPSLVANLQAQFDSFGLDVNLKEEMDKNLSHVLSSSEGKFESIPKYLQNIAGGIFSTITTSVVIFIFTAFAMIDLPKVKDFILNAIPEKYRIKTIALANAINRDLSGAIRGQLIICILNGFLTTIALLILNVKYAITLGIIAAICSMIPVLGTIFSLVPTVAIALTQSLFVALEVIAVILVIHLIEANLFNPKIMGTSVELHPAIIIFSIYIGEHLFGMAGLLLAVPVVAIVRSILIFVYENYFLEENFIDK